MRLLLAIFLCCVFTFAQDSRDAKWRRLNIPEGLGGRCCDLQAAYAARDGYIYISGDAGTYRARVESPEQWVNISEGLHKYERGIKPALVFGESGKGEIFAGVGHGKTCPDCEIVRWDANAKRWRSVKGDLAPSARRWSGFAFDSHGDLWATSYMAGSIYRSTDGGRSFKEVLPNAYSGAGQSAGAISAFAIIDDILYWGGEGALMRTSLDLKHSEPVAATGPDYNRNVYGVVSDGAADKGPASEIVTAGRVHKANGCGIQRFDVPSRTWSDSCKGAPPWWEFMALVPGRNPHEYYVSGSSSHAGGVYRSVDGGKTWEDYSSGIDQSLCNGAHCVSRITVSPVDGSKYVIVGQYQLWYHR